MYFEEVPLVGKEMSFYFHGNKEFVGEFIWWFRKQQDSVFCDAFNWVDELSVTWNHVAQAFQQPRENVI